MGFRYRYDPSTDQYAHAAVVVALSPDGTIARYPPPKNRLSGRMRGWSRASCAAAPSWSSWPRPPPWPG